MDGTVAVPGESEALMGSRSRVLVVAAAIGFVAAGCGGGGDSRPLFGDGDDAQAAGSGSTDGVDVCELLTPDEIMTAMGFPNDPLPAFETTGPSGPFTGCSWGTGWLLVQIAEADGLILPPTDDCPVLDLGEDARSCPGAVKFFADGIHVSISTLDRHPNTALEAIGRLMLPIVEAL